MSLKIDRLQLEIIINNDQARKSLRALEDEARLINKEMKGLSEGTQEWIQKSDRLKSIKQQMDNIYESIGITGLSLKELGKRQKELNMIMSQMDPRLPQYKEYQQQLAQINNRIGELKGKASSASLSFKGLADGFNRYFAMVTAGIAAFTGMVFSIKQLITAQGELTDSLANIRKSTGMTAIEVEQLNKQLGKIDTRTSRQDLRQMAVVAGQLGIAKKDIFSFVESVDQLNVALGDEFSGGAEEVARQMGMLRNVLTDMKTGSVSEDMMKVGNAINVLGAEGMATGPVMTDFASRIGGVGIPLGLTSDEVLGLSATLQELNVNAERGGTAVVKILQKMTTNTKDFAKIAGMPIKEFTQLVNTDLFGAFMKVIEGSRQGGQSATMLSGIIKELEISGVGASEIFAKLGTNTGMLSEKVKLAGDSLQGTASITNEFNIKNATLGAVLAKLQKDFYGLITMPNVTEFFKNQVYHVVQLVNWLKDLPAIIEKYRIGLIAITGITLAWVAAKTRTLQIAILNNLTMKEGILLRLKDQVVMTALIAQEELLTIWKGKGTVASKLAATAQLVWNAAVSANPLGAIIMGITALIAAVKIYDTYNSESVRIEKEKAAALSRLNVQNEKLVKANDELNKQVQSMNQLSAQEKIDLQNKIDQTLKLAEAELVLAEAKKQSIEKDSKKLSVWQFTWNWVKSSGMKDWREMNDADVSKNAKDATDGMVEGIDKLKQTIDGMKATKSTISDVLNAENIGDAVVAKTFDALTEKLSRYQVALRNTTAGSAEYNRIQEKIKNTNKELAKFQNEPGGDGKGRKSKVSTEYEKLNKKIQEYIELLQKQVIDDPAQARVTAEKIARLQKYKESIDSAVKSLQEQELAERSVTTLTPKGFDENKGLFKKQTGLMNPNGSFSKPNEASGVANPVPGEGEDPWTIKAWSFLSYADQVINGLMSIDQVMSNMENAQLQRDALAGDEKKKTLKRQLDGKLITQKQYEAGISRLDLEMDAKKRKLAHDQAVRQKALSLAQAIIGVAQAAAMALTAGPVIGQIMYALTAIMGAVQIGYIASQPIPAAAKGRYKALMRANQAAMGRYDVIGQSDGKYYPGVPYQNTFSGIPGKPLLVNETGNEIVIDPYTTKNLQMNYPQVLEAINLARVPQRATGGYQAIGGAAGSPTGGWTVGFDEETKESIRTFSDNIKKPVKSFVQFQDMRDATDLMNMIENDVAR